MLPQPILIVSRSGNCGEAGRRSLKVNRHSPGHQRRTRCGRRLHPDHCGDPRDRALAATSACRYTISAAAWMKPGAARFSRPFFALSLTRSPDAASGWPHQWVCAQPHTDAIKVNNVPGKRTTLKKPVRRDRQEGLDHAGSEIGLVIEDEGIVRHTAEPCSKATDISLCSLKSARGFPLPRASRKDPVVPWIGPCGS